MFMRPVDPAIQKTPGLMCEWQEGFHTCALHCSTTCWRLLGHLKDAQSRAASSFSSLHACRGSTCRMLPSVERKASWFTVEGGGSLRGSIELRLGGGGNLSFFQPDEEHPARFSAGMAVVLNGNPVPLPKTADPVVFRGLQGLIFSRCAVLFEGAFVISLP